MTTPKYKPVIHAEQENFNCEHCIANTLQECIELYQTHECEKYNTFPCEVCGETECRTNHWNEGTQSEPSNVSPVHKSDRPCFGQHNARTHLGCQYLCNERDQCIEQYERTNVRPLARRPMNTLTLQAHRAGSMLLGNANRKSKRRRLNRCTSNH